MNDRTTYSTWALGFLAGGIAGAGVALLFAPQSGRATRDGMRRKLHEADEAAHDLQGRIVRRGEALRDEATRRVSAAASALAGQRVEEGAAV